MLPLQGPRTPPDQAIGAFEESWTEEQRWFRHSPFLAASRGSGLAVPAQQVGSQGIKSCFPPASPNLEDKPSTTKRLLLDEGLLYSPGSGQLRAGRESAWRGERASGKAPLGVRGVWNPVPALPRRPPGHPGKSVCPSVNWGGETLLSYTRLLRGGIHVCFTK